MQATSRLRSLSIHRHGSGLTLSGASVPTLLLDKLTVGVRALSNGSMVGALLALALLIGPGCLQKPPPDPQTIVVGIESYPERLDPRFPSDAISSKINRLIYNGLFRLNDPLEVVPDLALDYAYRGDRILEIMIRDDVTFHNGKRLTSADVLATFRSVTDPQIQSPFKATFEKIEKMESLKENTIRLTLREPFSPLLTSLTLGILPEEAISANTLNGAGGNFTPVGTGPYQFEGAEEGQRVVLKRNDRYFGSKAKNTKITFKTLQDDTLRTLELIKGRIDLVQNAIPPALLPAVMDKDTLFFLRSPGINFSYIGFNLNDPILKLKGVRRAIALGINRQELIHYKLKDLATPATSLLHPGHWSAHSGLSPYPYNPDQAKMLLDQEGITDPDGDGPEPRLRLVYKTSTKRDRVEMAMLIAEHLRKIGVEVQVKSHEWGTFFRDIRTGSFQMYSLTWVGVTDPDIYYYAFHSSQTPPLGANRGFYHNPELDNLLERGRRTTDRESRIRIYREVQQIIFEDLPYIPLWYEDNWASLKSSLKGYSLRADAAFDHLVNTSKNHSP